MFLDEFMFLCNTGKNLILKAFFYFIVWIKNANMELVKMMRYHCKQLVRYENANEVGFCGNYIPMYWKNAVSFCHISLYALLYQPFSKKTE